MNDLEVLQRPTMTRVLADGKAYDFGAIGPADLRSIATHIRRKRIEEFYAAAPQAPIFAAQNAQAVAQIQCTPLTWFDLLYEWEGKLKWAFIAHGRAHGDTPETMLANLLVDVTDDFWFDLIALSGYAVPKREPGADPTKPAANTSATSTSRDAAAISAT